MNTNQPMNLCVRTDYCRNNVEQVIEYSHTLDVKHVWVMPVIKEHLDEKGVMDIDKLRAYQAGFERKGLTLNLLSETVDSKDIATSEAVKLKAEQICRAMECMGKAGIEMLFLFLGMLKPTSDMECNEKWGRLIELFQTIAPCAERSKVKIASHGHQFTKHLITGYQDMARIVSTVPSPYNGVTFCPGCHQLFDEDIYDSIRGFGKKIFFVHVRDIVRKAKDVFDEVLLGKGEIDVARVVSELEAIGYQGLICPEHLPHIAHHDTEEIETAWAYGYMQRLLWENMRRRSAGQ